MKKALTFLICSIFLSCAQKETKVEDVSQVDSVLLKSQAQVEVSASDVKKADVAVKNKTQKIIQKISYLTKEINNYKLEREQLISKSQEVKVIYKIDTVYVETKKNFWGKTKTSTSVKSDSTVTETIDSSSILNIDTTISQKIDTLKNN